MRYNDVWKVHHLWDSILGSVLYLESYLVSKVLKILAESRVWLTPVVTRLKTHVSYWVENVPIKLGFDGT